MIIAHLVGDKIHSNTSEAFTLFEKSLFGEKKGSKIEYSFLETLYLIQQKKLTVHNQHNKHISEDKLIRKARKIDSRFQIKLPVFSYLRKQGYIVKTALKFGAEFRIYDKGTRPGKAHAKWICYPVSESEAHSWYDFAAKNRVAHAAKKKLLLAVVDDEDDVTFYEVGWLRP